MGKANTTVYIRVTNDKYEHIIALEDTAVELARKCKTTPAVIYSSITHNRGTYKKVNLEGAD